MKSSILILMALLVFPVEVYGQNGSINNTLGTGGSFVIKDGSTTFLHLEQADGYFDLNSSLTLPSTTSSSLGIIFKGSDRFIHDYRGGASTGLNTFVGVNSGNFSMSGGSAPQGSNNTAVGHSSLISLTSGYNNSAFGSGALYSTTWGYSNSAFGMKALYYNTGASNSAFGHQALYGNTSGTENSAFGMQALYYNTGDYNSAFGKQSLYFNSSGTNNCAFGKHALYNNTTGGSNSAFGVQALLSNTSGIENSAFGMSSLLSNSGSYNSAFGAQALYSNTTGASNSAFGESSLYTNISGSSNSAFGDSALYSNTGSYNCAVGALALRTNVGSRNSAFGMEALYNNYSGTSNSAFGYQSGKQITSGSNNTCIGYDAQVPSGSSSHQVRIGNTSVTYAGIQVAWTVTSDRRWKSNILESSLGLDFVSKLKPVSYRRRNDEKQRTEYGFIAQEIEEVLKELGIENVGMLTIDDKGRYELRYNDLFAPIVKAIQEIKNEKDSQIARLRLENEKLKIEVQSLKEVKRRIARLEAQFDAFDKQLAKN